MRALVLIFATAAVGAITVTTLPRPPFPAPVTSAPAAKRLVVVSSRSVSPAVTQVLPCKSFEPPIWILRGLPLQRTFCAGGAFAVYGDDDARILLGMDLNGRPVYAYDFKRYVWPPRIAPQEREFVYEEIVWARSANGVLYVENAHLSNAASSYGRNAYVTAVDLKTHRRAWRSRALVANARTFAITPRYLITGYGFTAEPDWLYLLDRRNGRVVERLALPSALEKITHSGKNLVVRTYDHVLVVDLRES